jgi:hypothetical protein
MSGFKRQTSNLPQFSDGGWTNCNSIQVGSDVSVTGAVAAGQKNDGITPDSKKTKAATPGSFVTIKGAARPLCMPAGVAAGEPSLNSLATVYISQCLSARRLEVCLASSMLAMGELLYKVGPALKQLDFSNFQFVFPSINQ